MKRSRGNIIIIAVVLATTTLPLLTTASSVRGGGGGVSNNLDTNAALSNNNNNGSSSISSSGKKKIRYNVPNKRPAIPDDVSLIDKVRNWNIRQLDELLHQRGGGGITTEDSESYYGQQQQERKLYQGLHHKKSDNGYGTISVEHAPDLGFQHVAPPPPPPSPPGANNLNLMIAQAASGGSSPPPPPSPSMVNNNNMVFVPYGPAANEPASLSYSHSKTPDNDNNDKNDSPSSMSAYTSSSTTNTNNQYYPIYTPTLQIGTCTNNGQEPKKYHHPTRKENFMYDTLHKCCEAWYYMMFECIAGQAFVNHDGLLLKRDVITGELLKEEEGEIVSTDSKEEEEGEMTANFDELSTWTSNPLSDTTSLTTTNTNNNLYYPSFDISKYPNGACLNDGKQPTSWNVNDGWLFTNVRICCQDWFMEVELCVLTSSSSGGGGGVSVSVGSNIQHDDNGGLHWSLGNVDNNNEDDGSSSLPPPPTPFPTNENDDAVTSPWPTWSEDSFFQEDARLPATTISSSSSSLEDGAASVGESSSSFATTSDTDTTNININNNHLDTFTPNQQFYNEHYRTQNPNIIFYESFESSDFSKYDWSRPTSLLSSSSQKDDEDDVVVDQWEVDRTGIAYHGNYAARPGILSIPGSQSNLTITLESIETSNGGLLQYSIHASVELPMDVIYFTINNQIVQTYDKVSWNTNGDWITFTIILVPNVPHVLTWSYQYNGIPSINDEEYGMYDMDPRRVGNSWLDDIIIEEYTGDVIFSDDGIDTKSLLYNIGGQAPPESGGRSWSLIHDTNAFLGTHSYIAYSADITSNSGYTELSWTILAGHTGGILSFATFASVYAPHDVLEFSINDIPEVLFTTPSNKNNWEQTYIKVEPGKHVMKWKLIKNVAGLSQDVMNEVNVPADYQGYVKVDGIMYLDNQVHYDNAAASEEEEVEEETSTTTTEATDFTTSTQVWSTTTDVPEEEEETTTTTEATTTEWITTTTTTTTPEAIMAQNANAAAAASTFTSGGCPDGLQQVEGLPNCCIEEPNYLGDGACDPWGPYNTAECAYDLGDCCYETCNHDSPYGCFMKEGNDDGVGPFGFFCLDPRYSVIDESKCTVENREWIGDGGCDVDGGYNTEECGWDMGDCCEETCNEKYSFFPCGANQAYSCLSSQNESLTNPTGSGIEDSQYYFQDGFEGDNFDSSHWRWLHGDAAWEIEREDNTASEGTSYAEARTQSIIKNVGNSILELTLEAPPNGGSLSYQVQALIQAPREDVVVKVDDVVVDIIMNDIPTWTLRDIEIEGGGTHVIQWVHRKNPSDASDEDLAMVESNLGITRIDDVMFLPY